MSWRQTAAQPDIVLSFYAAVVLDGSVMRPDPNRPNGLFTRLTPATMVSPGSGCKAQLCQASESGVPEHGIVFRDHGSREEPVHVGMDRRAQACPSLI